MGGAFERFRPSPRTCRRDRVNRRVVGHREEPDVRLRDAAKRGAARREAHEDLLHDVPRVLLAAGAPEREAVEPAGCDGPDRLERRGVARREGVEGRPQGLPPRDVPVGEAPLRSVRPRRAS